MPDPYNPSNTPYDPWSSGTLPGNDVPASGNDNPAQSANPGDYAQYLQRCLDAFWQCEKNNPTDIQGCRSVFEKCRQDGVTIFQQGGKIQSATGDPACARCSPTNLPDCFVCYGNQLKAGAVHIGFNLLIGLVVLIGVYLLAQESGFTDQLAKGAKYAVI